MHMKQRFLIKGTVTLMIIIMVVFAVFSVSIYGKDSTAEYDGYIVKLREQAEDTVMLYNALQLSDVIARENGIYVVTDEKTAQLLAPQAEYVEPNYKVELMDTYKFDLYQGQLNVSMTKVKAIWDIGCYGNDIRIGVIDSGVYEHDALKENLVNGYNYLGKNTNTVDNEGHGTMVSGIIAAKYGYYVIGMAHRAKIVPIKCFEPGQTTYVSTIVSAIYGAVDDFCCDIINLSLGLTSKSTALEEAVNYAASKGVLLVAAVGNIEQTGNAVTYPAGFDAVIGVGSVNMNKQRSSFSNYNHSVFVTAPGEGILGLSKTGGYVIDSGTSFSAPVVTGIIATMLSIDNSLTLDSVKNILRSTSEDLGTSGYDTEYGYGLINAEAIVNYMLSGKDFFISPVDSRPENLAEVRIWKSPSALITPVGIWANYDRNRVTDIKMVPLSFADSNVEILQYSNKYNTLKCFLWYNTGNLLPLLPFRSVNQ